MHAVEIHPDARRELQADAQWYDVRAVDLGEGFLNEVDRALESIRKDPQAWPSHLAGTRRYLLSRFPYGIVYRLQGDVVWVFAIMHLRRRPGYWKGRLPVEGPSE